MSLKQKVAIVLDFSGSIQDYGLVHKIEELYTKTIEELRISARKNKIATDVSVYTFGTSVNCLYKSTNVNNMPMLLSYTNKGATALLDAISDAIFNITADPISYRDENTSFLIIVLTDGEENRSTNYNALSLKRLMDKVDKTGRFTITVNTPYSGRHKLLSMGFKPHNINVWDTNEKGMEEVESKTSAGLASYYNARSKGVRSINNFYSPDLSFSTNTLKRELEDVTHQFVTYGVPKSWDNKEIRDFIEIGVGLPYVKGKTFYQLTKKETIQANKELVVRDLRNGRTYSGADARELLGLPDGVIKVVPSTYTNKYELFVQSNSTNRHLVGGTKVLWRE